MNDWKKILPGRWKNEQDDQDELNISLDIKEEGIDIDLSKSKNTFLLSSKHEGSIHFSYDGLPLSHNSTKSGKDMRIDIIGKKRIRFYLESKHPNYIIYRRG